MKTYTTQQLARLITKKTGIPVTTRQVYKAVTRGELKNTSKPGELCRITENSAKKYLAEWEKVAHLKATGWVSTNECKKAYGASPSALLEQRGYRTNNVPCKSVRVFSVHYWRKSELQELFNDQRSTDWEEKDEGQCLYSGCADRAIDDTPYGFRFCPRHMANLNRIRAREAQKAAFKEIRKLTRAVSA